MISSIYIRATYLKSLIRGRIYRKKHVIYNTTPPFIYKKLMMNENAARSLSSPRSPRQPTNNCIFYFLFFLREKHELMWPLSLGVQSCTYYSWGFEDGVGVESGMAYERIQWNEKVLKIWTELGGWRRTLASQNKKKIKENKSCSG